MNPTLSIKLSVCVKSIPDYWKPDDIPIEDASDSSESSSLVTNFSMEKVKSLHRDVETSDSSEDEYIPVGESVYK